MARELRVISYYTYPDGKVVLWDDLSANEKSKIRQKQAECCGNVMSKYYRSHDKELLQFAERK